MIIDIIKDSNSSRFVEINQHGLSSFEVVAMVTDEIMSRSFGNNSGTKTFKTLKSAEKAANDWLKS